MEIIQEVEEGPLDLDPREPSVEGGVEDGEESVH